VKAIRIPEPTAWRPDAKTLLHFGTYQVPDDISAELAERAVAEGAAVAVEDDSAAIESARKRRGTK